MAAGDEDKTEPATPRKRNEAREKGQVAQSKDLIAAVMLFATLAALIGFGGGLAGTLGVLVVRSLEVMASAGPADLTRELAASLVAASTEQVVLATMPVLVTMVVVGLLAGYLQVGFRLTPKALEWKPSKLNPVSGFQRLLNAKSFMRAVMALGKILILLAVMSIMAWRQVGHLTQLSGSELGPLLAGFGHVVLRCLLGALLAVLIMAALDFLWQRFSHEKDMRMSKKEIRDEAKNAEGDPRIKSRIRQVQRELAMQRMMQAVPDATVVITNPTHYAVALKYERPKANEDAPPAPRCVAKGVDSIARRIREVAQENDVVLYEDPPLARALYAQVEIGDEIPAELYEAVANVLAFVYRARGVAAMA